MIFNFIIYFFFKKDFIILFKKRKKKKFLVYYEKNKASIYFFEKEKKVWDLFLREKKWGVDLHFSLAFHLELPLLYSLFFKSKIQKERKLYDFLFGNYKNQVQIQCQVTKREGTVVNHSTYLYLRFLLNELRE